jgi:hypothetical protein
LIKTELTKLPEVNVEWGNLSAESKEALISWTDANLVTFLTNLRDSAYTMEGYYSAVNQFAKRLFNEIYGVGYQVGYENGTLDNDEEGL